MSGTLPMVVHQDVETPRFECGALCGASTESQVRGGGPQATQAYGPFIKNKWAS